MKRRRREEPIAEPKKWYRGDQVPMAAIRKYVRQVAEQFKPDKIILFGSHAYGMPNEDSDVDILVVMPARNQIDQACRIDDAIDPPFPLDLIVRTPEKLAQRLAMGDTFLREILAKGKVLHEKDNGRMGQKGGSRLPIRRAKSFAPVKGSTTSAVSVANNRPRSI